MSDTKHESKFPVRRRQLTSDCGWNEAAVKVLVLLVLAVSPLALLDVSADDDTVAIDVKDSDDGSDVLSENAESASPTSQLMSPTVRKWGFVADWISAARASSSACTKSLPLSRLSSFTCWIVAFLPRVCDSSDWVVVSWFSSSHNSPKMASRFTSWGSENKKKQDRSTARLVSRQMLRTSHQLCYLSEIRKM